MGYGEYSSPPIQDSPGPDGRSRTPLIVLAQQQNPIEPNTFGGSPRPLRKLLSTISERTERTEASPHWPSRQQLVALNTPRPPTTSPSTSYGHLIGMVSSFKSP